MYHKDSQEDFKEFCYSRASPGRQTEAQCIRDTRDKSNAQGRDKKPSCLPQQGNELDSGLVFLRQVI